MTTTYTGPSVREMLESPTMALEIIARANNPQPVLGDKELAILRRFCMDTSSKDKILEEIDMAD